MNTITYQFRFDDTTELDEAESTLHLAILAAEGIFSEALLRVSFSYRRDDEAHSLHINGGDEVGETVVGIFTSFAIKEFGSTAFTVSSTPLVRPTEPVTIST